MDIVVAAMAHQFDNLLGSERGKGLPQTCHKTADEGCGEGGAHILKDCSARGDKNGRTAQCHHVGFYPSVGSVAHTAERGVAVLGGHCSHGKDVVGIGREGDLLPWTHTVVAGTVDEDNALAGKHGGSARDEGCATVEMPEGMIAVVVVVFIISQRTVDDIHAHGVGKLRRHRPIVLLDGLLGLLVLASQ